MHRLKQIFPYLKPYKFPILIGLVSVVVLNVFSLVTPLIVKHAVESFEGDVTKKLPPGLYGWVQVQLVAFASWVKTTNVSVGLGFSFLFMAVVMLANLARFFMRKILIGVSREVEYDLRKDFYERMQHQAQTFFHRHPTGDIMARATNDMNHVRMILGPGFMYTVQTGLLMLLAFYFMFSLNVDLSLWALMPFPFLVTVMFFFLRSIRHRYTGIQENFSDISSKTQENLSGLRVIRAFGREQSEIAEFTVLNLEYLKKNLGLAKVEGAMFPLFMMMVGMGQMLILWKGGSLVVEGQITLGDLIAFNLYEMMLAWPMLAIGWVADIFQRGFASWDRVRDLMIEPPEIHDSENASVPEQCCGALEVRKLTFTYPGTSTPALTDVQFTLKQGQTLAIVGPTGCGKTTLLQMICRVFDPPEGTVFMDGRDVREWPLRKLRKRIGYVPQEDFLFSESIRDNIAFARPEAPDAEVQKAARIAQLSGEIEGFPKEFETMLGERGITLSGGQKQRTAIARAILDRPPVMIFDDSLSNVDTYTEEKILSGLLAELGGSTKIIVSHRVSTVKGADLILVMEDGRIVERGVHEELILRSGPYHRLHEHQKLRHELGIEE